MNARRNKVQLIGMLGKDPESFVFDGSGFLSNMSISFITTSVSIKVTAGDGFLEGSYGELSA